MTIFEIFSLISIFLWVVTLSLFILVAVLLERKKRKMIKKTNELFGIFEKKY